MLDTKVEDRSLHLCTVFPIPIRAVVSPPWVVSLLQRSSLRGKYHPPGSVTTLLESSLVWEHKPEDSRESLVTVGVISVEAS